MQKNRVESIKFQNQSQESFKYTKKKKSMKLTLSLSNAAGSSYPRTISQNYITEEALK